MSEEPLAINDHPFKGVKVCFVPRASISNTLENLELVGTTCEYGGAIFTRINKLTCDRYFPAGSFVALNESGNIESIHTWSDIGQLDFAFNDYLNFLMDVRRIYEVPGAEEDKIRAIECLALGTGRQGHSHGYFVAKHGGARRLLEKCEQRKY
ncbi:hypothetical protein JFT81_02455 [Pseudomonas sp. TH43]|uniref:hypothetical protein n=1 Tax=Pseudomonas sp. TH43 TaxID=2796407 RepID=UPI0019127C35|nr:hypothetical protein [Pseudomonas sp. TH43]MBK5373496.1 hypothetical protein [Pseudomonas sp. TH43]